MMGTRNTPVDRKSSRFEDRLLGFSLSIDQVQKELIILEKVLGKVLTPDVASVPPVVDPVDSEEPSSELSLFLRDNTKKLSDIKEGIVYIRSRIQL